MSLQHDIDIGNLGLADVDAASIRGMIGAAKFDLYSTIDFDSFL